MRIPHDSVVLVTDGRKRLVFRNEGKADALALVVVSAAEDSNPRTRQQVTDAAGRYSTTVTGGGALPAADAHEIEEQRFAAETADELRRGVLTGEYARLVVMAPPKTLGQLRKNYHPEVEKRMLREIGKDVTGHPVGEIEKMLMAVD
jgi:protein required for attachment to host cells